MVAFRARVFAGAVTFTVATAPGVTVIFAVPFTPSTVAVIVATPVFDVVTRPPFTDATAGLSLVQSTAFPATTSPLGSLGVATSCCVWPAWSDTDVGLTSTRATTWYTVIVALLDLPSLAAVILAVPGVTPVTKPEAFTAATAELLVVQAIARSDITAPLPSRAAAESCAVAPTATAA